MLSVTSTGDDDRYGLPSDDDWSESALASKKRILRRMEAELLQRLGDVEAREADLEARAGRIRDEIQELRNSQPSRESPGLTNGQRDQILRSALAAVARGAHDRKSTKKALEEDPQLMAMADAIRREIVGHFGISGIDAKAEEAGREMLRQWTRKHIEVLGKDIILALCGIQKDSWQKLEIKGKYDSASNPLMHSLQQCAQAEAMEILKPQIREVFQAHEAEIVRIFKDTFASEMRKVVIERATTIARSYASDVITDASQSLTEGVIASMFPWISRWKAMRTLGLKIKPVDESV